MQSEDLHLSDQEMLLTADGELSTRQAAQVHAHLAECWDCRARMAEIEGTIADFARAHRQTLDSQLPPIGGPRALLRAQLAELASKREAASRRWFLQFTSGMRAAAFMCVPQFSLPQWLAGSWSTIPPCVEQTQSLPHSNAEQFRTAVLHQAQHGELLSATFVRWLTSKSSERYQCLCAKKSFGSTES